MTNSILCAAFPAHMRAMAEKATIHLAPQAADADSFAAIVRDETLTIPVRLTATRSSWAETQYAPDLTGLDAIERQVLHCLMTRSHNGYHRQAALREILALGTPWAMPFILAATGDYVAGIVADILTALPRIDRALLAGCIAENPELYRITRHRIESYWDCFYRDTPRADYAGFKLRDALDALDVHR